MTYSDAIIKRLTDLCVERGITTNKLATLSGICLLYTSSSEWKVGDEPYYPVNDEKNLSLIHILPVMSGIS